MAPLPRAAGRATADRPRRSRTSTGPTRPCSRSSTSSERDAGAVPLLVLGTTRPELRAAPDFPAARRPSGSSSSRCPTTRRRPSCTRSRDVVDRTASCSTPSSNAGRQPAVRRGVRPPPARSRPAGRGRRHDRPTADAELPVPDSIQALLAARIDALPAGLEGDPRRCRRDRQGVLGRRGRRDG